MAITRLINKTSVGAGSTRTDLRNIQQSALDENAKKSNTAQMRQNVSAPPEGDLAQEPLAIARYRFPDDLSIYYMGFMFQTYSRPNFKESPKKQITADIALPIPNNLIDNLEERWDEQEIGLLGHAIDQSGELVGQLTNNASVRTGAQVATGIAGGVAQGLVEQFSLSQGARLGLNHALRTMGMSFNPYLSIYFNGPRFKKHRFTWRFSPKNAKESETIRRILKTFHYNMSPDLSAEGIFFDYPNVVIPKIYNGPNQNEYLFDFKPCVIENVSINYAPNGIPSFFAGTKAPTEIEFQLSLSEINLWLKEDYA